jgi:hypothetical protein
MKLEAIERLIERVEYTDLYGDLSPYIEGQVYVDARKELEEIKKIRDLPKVGVQLTFRRFTQEEKDDVNCEYVEGIEDTDWALTDYDYFGHDTDPLSYTADAIGFEDIYKEHIHKNIIALVLERIKYEDNHTYRSNAHDYKFEIPVLLSYEYIPQVDFESGIDEGSFYFDYVGLLNG